VGQVHNQLQQAGQLLGGIKAALGATDSEGGIERYGETLQPIVNIWDRPEWALLRGEILFSRQVTSPALAARNSVVELVNPSTSRKIAVVRLIQLVQATGSVDFALDTGGSIAANPVTNRGVAMDMRFRQLGETSQCTIVTGDTAAGVTVNNQWRLREARIDSIPLGWVIRPGTKLFMATFGQLESMQLNLHFSERVPFPGELEVRG